MKDSQREREWKEVIYKIDRERSKGREEKQREGKKERGREK